MLVFEDAQLEVRALGLEVVELVGEKGEWIGAGGGGHGFPRNRFRRAVPADRRECRIYQSNTVADAMEIRHEEQESFLCELCERFATFAVKSF
jgi:hypothetical protein